ncbi:CRISPR-associated endonuclease Cas3'' [Microbispora siamensis]|uniref:CRISPR-associated endonuclease Cas3'' n=1 Tax=Microbispora siamensis TaxID=564413 RepID=UPI001EF26072|nr:CRISPR-associated endonuclease Cas3'' [Microbispora siamensis]
MGAKARLQEATVLSCGRDSSELAEIVGRLSYSSALADLPHREATVAGPLWAHSARDGDGLRHELGDHLRGTAWRAGAFGEVFDAGPLAAHCGLVHDVGKGCDDWQCGLIQAESRKGPVGVPHKHAGTWLLDRQNLGILAAVVFGHHGGLPSRSRLKEELRFADTDPLVAEAIRRVEKVVPEIHPVAPIALPRWLPEAANQDPVRAGSAGAHGLQHGGGCGFPRYGSTFRSCTATDASDRRG